MAAKSLPLILSGKTLVGTSLNGGVNGTATIFTVKTNGSDFAAIYQFSANDNSAESNPDGAYPNAGVILADNRLYGTAKNGGDGGRGSVFAMALPIPPSLRIGNTGNNVSVSWPTAAVGFDLQASTDLAAANWTNVTGSLMVVDTNFVFTTPVDGAETYFRLRR